MATDMMGELVASQGTYLLNKQASITDRLFDKVIILEDSVITGLRTDSTYIGDYIADNEIPLKTGAFLTPLNGEVFNGINLVSGSVLLIWA